MKRSTLAAATLAALTALPGAAFADLAFNVGAVSDYRYRGISQSRLKPAVQGGVDYDNSGFYVGAWASSIKWIKDAGGDASAEIDLYGGYKGDIVKDSLTYDVGVLTYQYPNNKLPTKAETYEIYGALTYGPATLKYSHSVSNLFGFADSKNSGYVDLSASFEVASGLTLVPHVGYQHVAHASDFSYTDYSLAVNYEVVKGLVLNATAVGTDTKKIGGNYAYISPAGKNLGRAGLVVGIKYSF
ncbi:MAG: TorF family putative porin [Rubrivivax sp.]